MMRIENTFILLILIITFVGCTQEEKISSNKDLDKTDNIVNTKNSNIELKETTSYSNDSEVVHDETELNFVVSVAEGYNYDSLKIIALKAANFLNLKLDSLGRYYNADKKSIVLPDNDEDEIYAGEYLFRRHGEDFTSIEMNYAYLDTSIANNELEVDKVRSDTTKMFVFAMMYTEKNRADSLARILKKEFSSTKIIPARIYMGCMH